MRAAIQTCIVCSRLEHSSGLLEPCRGEVRFGDGLQGLPGKGVRGHPVCNLTPIPTPPPPSGAMSSSRSSGSMPPILAAKRAACRSDEFLSSGCCIPPKPETIYQARSSCSKLKPRRCKQQAHCILSRCSQIIPLVPAGGHPPPPTEHRRTNVLVHTCKAAKCCSGSWPL